MANLYALNDAVAANPMLAQMVPPELYMELLDIPGLKQRVREQQERMMQAQAQQMAAGAIPQSQQQQGAVYQDRPPSPAEQMAGMTQT